MQRRAAGGGVAAHKSACRAGGGCRSKLGSLKLARAWTPARTSYMVEQGEQGALEKAILHIVSGGLSVLLRTRRQSYAHVRNRSRGQRRRSQSITSTYWTDHKSRATAEGDALGRPRPKSTIARYRLSRQLATPRMRPSRRIAPAAACAARYGRVARRGELAAR